MSLFAVSFCSIQQVAWKPCRGRFTIETPLQQERRSEIHLDISGHVLSKTAVLKVIPQKFWIKHVVVQL